MKLSPRLNDVSLDRRARSSRDAYIDTGTDSQCRIYIICLWHYYRCRFAIYLGSLRRCDFYRGGVSAVGWLHFTVVWKWQGRRYTRCRTLLNISGHPPMISYVDLYVRDLYIGRLPEHVSKFPRSPASSRWQLSLRKPRSSRSLRICQKRML